MLTQRTELSKQLPLYGWQLLHVEVAGLEWWADEIWVIESIWSPHGFRLFLTFLVDPMAGVQRAKGQAVWAVGTACERPADRRSAEAKPLLKLGSGWRSQVEKFFEGLAKLRAET